MYPPVGEGGGFYGLVAVKQLYFAPDLIGEFRELIKIEMSNK